MQLETMSVEKHKKAVGLGQQVRVQYQYRYFAITIPDWFVPVG